MKPLQGTYPGADPYRFPPFYGNQKNRYVNIFLIQVNRKLNLENIFDIIFVYSFCQLPEKDKSHRQVLAAKFFTHEIDRTCLALHSLQHGHWLWRNNSQICKASSRDNGIGKFTVWLTQKTRKGHFRYLKLENFPGEHAPDPPRSLRLRRSFCSKSVNIFPRSASAIKMSWELQKRQF